MGAARRRRVDTIVINETVPARDSEGAAKKHVNLCQDLLVQNAS
jgi:hypothetical protein